MCVYPLSESGGKHTHNTIQYNMKTIDFYYILTGFEKANPFIAKFTFTELANNEGAHKDTEMFYALQEQPEKVCTLELYKPLEISINRDDQDDRAMMVRVPKDRYLKTETAGLN